MLCVRRGGLGDTLLMVPVLRAMRRARPGTRLTFAGVAEFAAVLQRHGVVDDVRSTEDLGLWALRAGGDAQARARARLDGFAWIVGDDPALAALSGPGCRVDLLDPVLAAEPPRPAAEQLLARAGLAGGAAVTLRRPEAAPAGAPAVLHIGSGSAQKCWPQAVLRSLARELAARGPLVVLAGPAELDRGELRGWSRAMPVVPNSVDELAAVLAGARAYVGHDSGPTHLAAALGVPVVALFTVTDPRIWAPQGRHVRVVTGPPSVAAVLAALGS